MLAIGKVVENGIEKTLVWSDVELSIFEQIDGRNYPTDLCGLHTVEDAIDAILGSYDEPDIIVDRTSHKPEA